MLVAHRTTPHLNDTTCRSISQSNIKIFITLHFVQCSRSALSFMSHSLTDLSILIRVPAELQWGSIFRAQTDRSSTLQSSQTLHSLPGSPGKGNRDTGSSCHLLRPLHTHTHSYPWLLLLSWAAPNAGKKRERCTASLSFTLGHKKPVICLWALTPSTKT